MKKLLFLLLNLLLFHSVAAQNSPRIDTLEVQVLFQLGKTELDPVYRLNRNRIEKFLQRIEEIQKCATNKILTIRIATFSSPDGSIRLNKELSVKRAQQLAEYLQQQLSIPDSLIELQPNGEDWKGLERLVEASEMPYRNEVLRLLQESSFSEANNRIASNRCEQQLRKLHNGQPWQYLCTYIFPELRKAGIRLLCQLTYLSPEEEKRHSAPMPTIQEESTSTYNLLDTSPTLVTPALFALKTNLLYDALLVPNVGVEFYLGKQISIAGNWMYAWWKSNTHQRFWRIYGGELSLRKYFGSIPYKYEGERFTGHHLGIYIQGGTYDIKPRKKDRHGYLSDFSYGAGIEYGYAIPLAHRLNLNFVIGMGYFGGKYKKYTPIDTHYVWLETKQRHWFGPTKAEVSLAWLLDRQWFCRKKGGRQ